MTEDSAMPGAAADLLARLGGTPPAVREAASRIPDPAAPGDPSGGWSTVQVVAQAAGMDSAAWRRTGTHEVFGELDVAGLLREAHKHDLEHLADLERRRGTAPDA